MSHAHNPIATISSWGSFNVGGQLKDTCEEIWIGTIVDFYCFAPILYSGLAQTFIRQQFFFSNCFYHFFPDYSTSFS